MLTDEWVEIDAIARRLNCNFRTEKNNRIPGVEDVTLFTAPPLLFRFLRGNCWVEVAGTSGAYSGAGGRLGSPTSALQDLKRCLVAWAEDPKCKSDCEQFISLIAPALENENV